MNGENERLKRIEEFLLDPERALFTTLEEFRSAISEILPVLAKIDFATLETLKGEDGKTPQRGVDYMTQEDIDALEAFILSKMPRADVDYASIEATEAFIRSEIAKIPRIKGDPGEPGKPGLPGKAGSPDSGADILRKLRELGKNQGLQIKDIRGLENRIKIYNTAVDELAALKQAFEDQRIVIPTSIGQGGGSGGGVTSITAGTGISLTGTATDPVVNLNAASIASLALADTALQNITGLISQGTNVTITGTGTSGDPYVINSSGSGFTLTNGRGTTANGTAVDLGGTYSTNVELNSAGGGASFYINNIGQTGIYLGDTSDANGGAILSVASNVLTWKDTALVAKFGINVASPDTALHVVGSIKMVDGNEANGFVLTSDVDGVGSWQALPSTSGFVTTNQTVGQTIGDTTNRLTKLWATDITVTNAIAGSVTGNAGTVTNGVYTTDAGTVFLAPNGSAASLTSFPTFNQNTNGSAATLTTTRTIWGQNFNGSANVTGTLALGTSDLTLTGSVGATGARATKVWTADLESTNMPTVNGTSLSSTFAPIASPTFTGTVGLPSATLAGTLTLAENASIALDPAGSADGKYSGVTMTGTGGATIAFGEVVYLDAATSRWKLADADAASTADRMLAIAVTSSTDGAAITLLLQGIIRADAKFPALTIGSAVYVGETPGAIQVAIPTGADNVIRRVGYALTADEIYWNPSMDSQITVA